MYAFIYFTKYKSSCSEVLYKIAVLEIFEKKNRNIPVMEYFVSKVGDLSAISLKQDPTVDVFPKIFQSIQNYSYFHITPLDGCFLIYAC